MKISRKQIDLIPKSKHIRQSIYEGKIRICPCIGCVQDRTPYLTKHGVQRKNYVTNSKKR